jgi:hypothetical protein
MINHHTKNSPSSAAVRASTKCDAAKSATASDTSEMDVRRPSGIKTACLPMTRAYKVAMHALAILSREGLSIRESEVFMNADFRTTSQIAVLAGQLTPNVKVRLWCLAKKGVLAKTADLRPRWHWTDKGTRIMQEINECAG